jgi:hypothetical protein
LNTRSLGQVVQKVRRCCDIGIFFLKTTPQLKVILLQEHHMGSQDYLKKTNSMDFKRWASFWNDVIYSIDYNTCKAGTCIIVSTRHAPMVKYGIFILG